MAESAGRRMTPRWALGGSCCFLPHWKSMFSKQLGPSKFSHIWICMVYLPTFTPPKLPKCRSIGHIPWAFGPSWNVAFFFGQPRKENGLECFSNNGKDMFGDGGLLKMIVSSTDFFLWCFLGGDMNLANPEYPRQIFNNSVLGWNASNFVLKPRGSGFLGCFFTGVNPKKCQDS